MAPNFSTTTTVSFAVGMISIMAAMKHYFNYKFLCGGCGFPYVTIEGSVEDWTKILSKLNDMKKYDFEWFTTEISEIINKIIDTKKGSVDLKFWKEMIKYKAPDGAYSPHYADGWFMKFFPYDNYGNRTGPIHDSTDMPSELLSVPILIGIMFPGMKEEHVKYEKYELLAGFVGLTQNQKNASLKPEIGWMLRKKKEVPDDEEHQRIEVYKSKVRFNYDL